MNQNIRPESEHLSMETLAVLAEEGRSAADARTVEHLTHCRSCMAAYADAVRYRTAWLGSPGMFEGAEEELVPVPTKPRSRFAGFPIAAGFLLVVGLGAWALSRRPAPVPAPSGAIAALLERASGADLVLPGGERGAAAQSMPYREGGMEDRASQEAVEQLRLRYENGARTTEALYLLAAALTASARTDIANDYVQEGRRSVPGHTGFMLLEAAIARRDGQLDRADRILRKARGLAPKDPTLMLDHAILLKERGAGAEASALLRQVTRSAPGSPLARRAEQLLAAEPPN